MASQPQHTSDEIRSAALVVADQIHRRGRKEFMPIFERLKGKLEAAELRERKSMDVAAFLTQNQST